MDVIFLLKNKQDIFGRFSKSSYRFRKNPESGKGSLRDSLIGSCPVIDAEFVEVSGDSDSEEAFSDEMDSELLENLREYLRTRSKEEITEIFEEIRKTLEERTSESGFSENRWKGTSSYEKMRMKEIPGRAFRTFSRTACCGKDQIIKFSKVVSSKASSIASEGRESVKASSKILNEKWSNLSPRDRELISDTIIAVIELGLLKNSTKGKKAAFVILSGICNHKAPGKKDLEEFIDGVSRLLKRRT
jgi:predicted house-cleaning noncanonical NTP pyrophosphatase (MazG superfamily)